MSRIRVGKPNVKPEAASHTPGVHQGNGSGHYAKGKGHLPDGRSTAQRSTGISHKNMNPILPGMPNLSPP